MRNKIHYDQYIAKKDTCGEITSASPIDININDKSHKQTHFVFLYSNFWNYKSYR